MAKEIELNKLDRIVRDERKGALVLFFGNWCIDCQRFKPVWEVWTERRDGPIFTVEIMRGDPGWKDWSIDEIPTVAAFVRGVEVGRVHGTISPEELDRLWKLVSRARSI